MRRLALAGMLLGGTGSVVLVLVQMTWGSIPEPIGLPLIVVTAVIGLCGAAYVLFHREPKRVSAQTVASLPLTITAIPEPSYSRNSGLWHMVTVTKAGESKQVEMDRPKLGTSEVFISNTSTTRALNLEISLSITDHRGNAHKLDGRGTDHFGRVLGTHDVGSQVVKHHGIADPGYILSPLSLPPQASARGRLNFLLPMEVWEGQEQSDLDEFAKKMWDFYFEGILGPADKRFKYALEIEDLMTRTVVSLPLPSEGYRGA